ncbi:glycoside hydrolase family 13 protein [Shewanella sp. OMA3-2]|uniref:glycoside hydrolase family 13 protein n=1 Tax=Shewanella sp. OMA3-2 TaxID=2908650 RepID=UPI001F35F003|nr:glycoside hydrolase family 13 protein [Shewanella sp. OMA3-2]UJF20953.1 glycoside hydrolase family 13 protein [Shewanella sp. OMA3-2]
MELTRHQQANALISGMIFSATVLFSAATFADIKSAKVESAKVNSVAVEPEFWWSGMHNSQLQLLVYGKNISQFDVKLINATDINLVSVDAAQSDNHLFINLDLANAQPQTLTIGLYDNNTLVQRIDYAILAREKESRNRQGFSNKDVIYLITPDRFVNGNPDNDNHLDMLEQANRADKDGRHGGDIMGIRKALPYLKDLGVTQLWINPLLENNQAQYSYHGYSTTNFYKIDPRFGSNQEYKSLVEEANTFGIGIIKDVVVNHMGSGHQWMKPNGLGFPTSTWINGQAKWQQDSKDITYTSHRRTTVQDPYTVTADTAEFEDGWFTDTMPDLNQRDPHFATYLIQNSIWWVEYAGLSGIREDTYSYADKAFLAKWSKAVMDEYPHFNIVGEEWTANPVTVSYWQAGKNNKDGYQSYVPSMMDFPLYEKIISSLNEKEDWGSGLINLYEMLANDVVYADPTELVLFEGNHDTNRLYSLLNEDMALYKMAMAYVLTSNRIPQIFYGTEIAMTSPTKDRNDGAVRADFPGGWQSDSSSVLDNTNLSASQLDALNFNKTLLNYRKKSVAIASGTLQHFAPKNGVYVQFRQADGETLMIIYNKNEQPVELDLQRFNQIIQQSKQAKDILTSKTYSLDSALKLTQKGVTILSITQ